MRWEGRKNDGKAEGRPPTDPLGWYLHTVSVQHIFGDSFNLPNHSISGDPQGCHGRGLGNYPRVKPRLRGIAEMTESIR